MFSWFTGCIVLITVATAAGQTVQPRRFSSCRFSFEKRSELIQDNDANWQGDKTDYIWGNTELRGRECRHIQYVIFRTSYSDKTMFLASVWEKINKDGTELFSRIEVEGPLRSMPVSIGDAKVKHRGLMSTFDHGESYVFDPTPELPFFGDLYFLGYLDRGPIWELSNDRIDNEFRLLDEQGTKWQFHLDPDSLLFHTVIAETSNSRSEMKLTNQRDGERTFVTKTQMFDNSGNQVYSDIQELVIRDLEFDTKFELDWANSPPEGARVHNRDTSQIGYEWRNGKITKVLDRSIDDIDVMRFPRRRRSLIVVASLLLLCVAYIIQRRRTRA